MMKKLLTNRLALIGAVVVLACLAPTAYLYGGYEVRSQKLSDCKIEGCELMMQRWFVKRADWLPGPPEMPYEAREHPLRALRGGPYPSVHY